MCIIENVHSKKFKIKAYSRHMKRKKRSESEFWEKEDFWWNTQKRLRGFLREGGWVEICMKEGIKNFWENEIEREFLEKEGVTGNLERKKESEFWDTEGEWQGMLREEGKTGGILRERRRFRGKIWKEESSKIKSDKEGGSEV